jgi:hypothetical protein
MNFQALALAKETWSRIDKISGKFYIFSGQILDSGAHFA